MPRVTLLALGLTLDAELGARLLDVTRAAGVPHASSCGGVGVCGACRVTVLGAAGGLSAPCAFERAQLVRLRAEPGERVACLARVLGDVTVTAAYW